MFCHIHASVECLGSDPALFFHRFCEMVNSITEEAWKGPEEGDCDNETLEVALSVLTCSASTLWPSLQPRSPLGCRVLIAEMSQAVCK